jgi:hypothetical protein
LFAFSIAYLFLLFAALLADHGARPSSALPGAESFTSGVTDGI